MTLEQRKRLIQLVREVGVIEILQEMGNEIRGIPTSGQPFIGPATDYEDVANIIQVAALALSMRKKLRNNEEQS